MSAETHDIFKKVIKRAIDTELMVKTIRSRLHINLEQVARLSYRQIFDQLDWLNRGYITKQDIKRVIDQFSQHLDTVVASQRSHPDSIEMEALMRRFNKDKQNGRISLPEFVDELSTGG